MENYDEHKKEIEMQKGIAYTAGLLRGDVTIKTLLESLAEGVVIINELGSIILINDRFAELTGYEKYEIMGKSLDIFLPKENIEKHNGHIKSFFSLPRNRSMGLGMDLVAKRKDNSVFPVEISLSHLKVENSKLAIAFVTDITLRKKAQDDLNNSNIELDAYAHTVAHDLNSPLFGIIGYSEMLLDPEEEIDDNTRKEILEGIVRSGRKMSNIIRELLVFATLRKDEVDITKVEMKQIIVEAKKRLRFQIDQDTSKIIIKDNIVDCLGYAPWIEEVWFNYLSNAVKYGGSPLVVEIGSEKTDSDFIKYYVKDNGDGISEELKSIMFQTKNNAKDKLTKGTGLGLPIVKSIVEKLGGYVEVESEKGKGSIMSFYLKEYTTTK
jgi:PAS domain S-box-containing protein